MSQFVVTFQKTLKCFLRTRGVLFWTLAWPVFLLVIVSTTALSSYSGSMLVLAKGSLTISMIAFALMLAGFANLATAIARDKETGLLAKLKSMPVSPIRDFAGRIAALAVLSLLATALVTAAGFALGARFGGGISDVLSAIGFLFLVIVSAAGIGLVIGTFSRVVQSTAFIGIGVTLITAYVSGIFVPYETLPGFLQAFARIYPISSATSAAADVLLGQDVVGYDPLTTGHIATTIVLSFLLLALGLWLHSRLIAQRDWTPRIKAFSAGRKSRT